jgi:hypothetical protein
VTDLLLPAFLFVLGIILTGWWIMGDDLLPRRIHVIFSIVGAILLLAAFLIA